MNAATDAEVLKWLAEIEWNHGIKVDGKTLSLCRTGPELYRAGRSGDALRTTYFARVASMLGIEDESRFHGALLWITLSTIGSPQLEKAGWKPVEKMRQGYGENRSLQTSAASEVENAL